MKRRVVVTGLGAITPIGNTVDEMWNGVKSGKCGIDLITRFDTSDCKVKIAGEVKANIEELIDKRAAKRMDRFSQFAVIASKEAYKNSGLEDAEYEPNRFGVLISSGIGGLATIEREHSRALEKGSDRISPFFVPMNIVNLASGNVAIELGAHGMCSCVVTACAGGTNALGDAFRHIRDGYAEIMVAGGAEAAITPLGMGGFTSMKALCESNDPSRASIPFDAERSGFVMGEGAGSLILEEYKHAKKRGANIIGEIVGYGATCDAHHITAPCPDGMGAAAAMTQAMEDAGITSDKIGYINAHGTATPLNDSIETTAIKLAFGDHAKALAVSSTKSMTGHMLGASGAVEAIVTVMAVSEGFLPPTINHMVADPECDLDVVPNIGRKADLEYAMSNSLGFGGHNASVVFKKIKE
ncbi:MAG: beta-ketoacyl-ACP synthase II [Oscillospiraceae bacterium]|nr:beta-ketoacyl-ACP synthase II [Oscillospiraceae bacterium]MDD4413599.1 beta-ketoacyl-ACP synthase II [Oscillospiraceae bacterium]